MTTPYQRYNFQLLEHVRTILAALESAEQVPEESHALFLERFDELLVLLPKEPLQSQYLGQDLLSQIFQRYPQIGHLVPRDLLWFFGGDCLHFMADEELALYQALEERRHEAQEQGEPFDWVEEKQRLHLA
ncbi:PA2817 family protein [Pseudomonas juntendi]|nr:PA2817 family protein [Pseudomonas juntendi]